MSFAAVLERLGSLENPYPGLRAFETSEAHLFFGRDQQINELIVRLERRRLITVVGVSGSGKSSLVRAGLIPALHRGRVAEAASRWRIVVTHPGGAPYANLAEKLSAAGLDPGPLRRSSYGLIHIAQQLPAEESLLVVVDQFEEIFRYKDQPHNLEPTAEDARRERDRAGSEAYDFVQVLLSATSHQPPVYIVITMRSDYLGDCAEFRNLPESLNECQYLIPRLTREQRRQAIEYPLGTTKISPALVQRMLNDVGDEPDQLPILQHAMMRTWDQWRKSDPERTRGIELADYELAGEFQGALDQHADELLQNVPANIAGVIFKRLTARGANHRERRDPARLLELWELCGATTPPEREKVTEVVEYFRRREATFLQPREGSLGPDEYIDIAHESLIRQWKKLRDEWLPQETKSAKRFQDLVGRARKWRSEKGELLTGLDLADALEWNRTRNPTSTWAKHYSDESALADVSKFIQASLSEDNRREWRRRRNFGIAIAASVLFAMLAGIAGIEWHRARQSGRISKARELIVYANQNLNKDPELSILLAMYAVNSTEPAIPAARDVLYEAILGTPLTLSGHQDPVIGVTFSPDGGRLATASVDGTAKVWDAKSGKELLTLRGHSNSLYSLAFSPDGGHLATASVDGTAKVWDAKSGKELLTLRGHFPQPVIGVAFSRDGKRLATASVDRSAKVWDSETGRELLTLRGHSDGVTGVAFSPDGRRLATASTDQRTKVWDAESGKKLLSLGRHYASLAVVCYVVGVAFSPDGRHLATGSADGTAKVWDAESGKELPTLHGHSDAVIGVVFSPDGRRLATGSADGTAKVWDRESNNALLTMRGHSGYVSGVAFSPDGKRLATASRDKTAKVWDARSRQELETLNAKSDRRELLHLARSRVTRNPPSLTLEECKRYFQVNECPPLP